MIFNQYIAGEGGSGEGFVVLPVETIVAKIESWTRPTVSSATEVGFVTNAENNVDPNHAAWKALDGSTSGYATLRPSSAYSTFWWKWTLPYYLAITTSSYFTITQRNTSEGCGGWKFYADVDRKIPLTAEFSTSGWASTSAHTINCIGFTGTIYTDTIYLYSNTVSSWPGMAELQFTNFKKATLTGSISDMSASMLGVGSTVSIAMNGQTTGYKNDICLIENAQGTKKIAVCKTGTLPQGAAKTVLKSATPLYLNTSKTEVVKEKEGMAVTVTNGSKTENFTKVGSVSITDEGIASGFSSSNYLKIDSGFNPGNDTWEIVCAINKTSSAYCHLFGGKNTTCNIVVSLSGNTLTWYLSSNGTSWNLASGVGSYTITTNRLYYIKASYNGTEYKLEASTDGTNWSTSSTITSSAKIYPGDMLFGAAYDQSYPLVGYIDLNNSCIKINGSVWWTPYTIINGSVAVAQGHKYADETVGYFELDSTLTRTPSQMIVHPEDFPNATKYTPNYTSVGTPTIVDGKITTPATGYVEKYITIPSSYSRITAIFKAEYKDGVYENIVMSRAGDKHFIAIEDNKMRCWTGSSVTTTFPIVNNTIYWFKMEQVGSTYTIYVKVYQDGETLEDAESFVWTQALTTNYNMFASDTYRIGRNGAYPSTQQWTGFLDLKNSAIYVDGVALWMPFTRSAAKAGYLHLTMPTAATTSTVLTGLQNPTAAYAGSVCTPGALNKKVILDTTLTNIIGSEDI